MEQQVDLTNCCSIRFFVAKSILLIALADVQVARMLILINASLVVHILLTDIIC